MNMLWALLAMAFGSFGVAPIVADQGNPQFQSLTNSFNTAIIQSQKDQVVIDADNPPAKMDPQPDAPVVKGIYVTAYSAGGARMKELLELTDNTELNAMVIDIKDDLGYITYHTENKALQKMG
ncbi:GTP-binding protein, partial [Paenibacillus sp. PCH8]|uniref:putative glycoside hydrolase n=1 Tax=Paenibacillus sp. PCH8 TaxID=2066524 RepID=UPI000D4E6EEA